ncbi:PH domain-containing protein [Niallia sp. Krafla_26]|uniref:PH domain-containing protein n=1 Tax=Niallia sp. Krafla_26 TaxID=3064703 RepID=UPI003D16E049
MSEPRRLHPVAAVISFLKSLKEAILPLVLILFFGGNDSGFGIWQVAVFTVFILFSLISGILSWFRFTYRVEDGELRIESGLFVKKKRYIPFERIQSLDFSEGLLQRPFELVKVKIETAGSSSPTEAEAVLTAIKKSDALAIQEILTSIKYHEKSEVNEADPHEQEVVYKMTPAQLILLASTSGGAGVVISGAIAFILQFDELIPYDFLVKEFQGLIANGILFISILVFLVLLFAWVIAIVGTILKYAGYTVVKKEDDLIISRGLLEKRQLTVPLNRIQGIMVSENMVRQPFGLCSVYLESAGGSLEKDALSKTLLLPIIKKREVEDLLTPLLSDYQFAPKMVRAPKRALRRYLLRGMIIPIIIILVSLIFFRPWGYLSLLLLPLSAFWAYLKHKDAGWNLNEQQLTLTYRRIDKNTIFMRKNKIQSLSMWNSYFQDKQSLASIEASIVSGIGGSGGTVIDLEAKDVKEIYNWYQYKSE